MLTCILVLAVLTYIVSHPWPVELLQDSLLYTCLAGMTKHIMILSQYGLGETLQYVQFSFVHQEITKVVCQYVLISMLAMCVIPVPPQLRIVLLLELNLVKEVGHSHVHGHTGQEINVSGDGIWKDVNKSLGILNATLRKEISKIFSPV